jgi:hypothetical protein
MIVDVDGKPPKRGKSLIFDNFENETPGAQICGCAGASDFFFGGGQVF